MLTDIFARRYETRPLFTEVAAPQHRLLVQAFRIINEQLLPYYVADKVDERAKAIWTSLHDRLTMELGINELSQKWYSYQTEWMGKPHTQSGYWEMNKVCEMYITQTYASGIDPDRFMKDRLSFVELAFRERENQIKVINLKLPNDLRKATMDDLTKPGLLAALGTGTSRVALVQKQNDNLNEVFKRHVDELNTRFQQAKMPLNYHNGYIQITTDPLVQAQIEQPFWELVQDPKWVNVSTDMTDALDRRDTGGRDPAFYAAKALESTIKIISDEKQWTTGKEPGVGAYLDHLATKANGPFVETWEKEVMQRFFSGVRNDLGHGPGKKAMPKLTEQQTDFSIEFCMSWIKSLITRL